VFAALAEFGMQALEAAVAAASGWSGLLVIFVYSFLIAFILPLPSEIVLCPVGYVCAGNTLGLPLPLPVQVVIVIATSGLGKAAGSLIALYVGHGASHSGPVIRALQRLGFDPMEWSRKRMVSLTKRYGYVGMAMGLTVPGFPDTLSIYAFSVLEDDYQKFAAAAFAGSAGRLIVTIGAIEGIILFA
jgi:membrane protein YqaA with SNARE-associated domain